MSEPINRDPLSAWQHLRAQGGLEVNGRDKDLGGRILNHLDPRASSLEQALSATDMTSFVRAFFEALHPYVSMFRDILDFFEHSDATRGESRWRLQVDDTDLGLEHFREWLTIWDGIATTAITVPAIDAKAAWQLYEILLERRVVQVQLRNSFQNKPLDISNDVRHWVSAYEKGDYLPLPESLNLLRRVPALAKSTLIAFAVLQRLLNLKLTPTLLKELYDEQFRDGRMPGGHCAFDPSDGFNIWTIAQHETDLWLRSFVIALSASSQLPISELTVMGKELDIITDRYPMQAVQVDVTVSDLESVLSLPIWEKRFDLYSVWIATEIIRALKGHDVEIHHDHGRIPFAFKETTIATIHSSPGPFKLISERRIPLEKPKGEGRKGGVQPDHGLWTRTNGREVCKMVIEVKHYKNSSKAKFINVFEDYARALPEGDIYLINHGPAGNAAYEVSRTIRDRCKSIDQLTASNVAAREQLASAVRKCIGDPMPRWPTEPQRLKSSTALLIDVSGSMHATMRSATMNLFIRVLANCELPAKLVAADQKIVGVWETGETGFDELLQLDGGSTDLSQPVSELLNTYKYVLVITDKEGVATIQGVEITPYSEQVVTPPGIEVRVCKKK